MELVGVKIKRYYVDVQLMPDILLKPISVYGLYLLALSLL